MKLQPGTRLRSQVCSTEVIVVRSPAEPVEVSCGGHPMIPLEAQPESGLTPKGGQDGGSQLGKRYIRKEGDLELLVTKSGDGALGIGHQPLTLKESKPLPSSD